MPVFCPEGIDLGVKPSAPSCPPTLPPYPGLPTEQTETQGTCQVMGASFLVETQTEIQAAPVSGEVQIPVSIRPRTTLVSTETQIVEVRGAQTGKTKGEMQVEMEDRRQTDKEEQVSAIYPWDHMWRAARAAEEQLQKLLLLHKEPTGKNNQSVCLPFSYQEIQRIKEDLENYLEYAEKYTRAFKGATLFYDLTWKDVRYILGQTLTPYSKTRVLEKAFAYGDEWVDNESAGKRED